MEWIQYVIFLGLVAWVVSRFLPVKGLQSLRAEELTAILKKNREYLFVDVREPFEYKNGHIEGFRNIPLSILGKKLHELDRSKQVVLTCQSGVRSKKAAKLLLKQGFQQVSHLNTGFAGWRGKVTR